jgi:DNA-binding NtrC family response regulator
VVDDDRLVRIMVQLGLERNGFAVWSARNVREAIDQYREHRQDIAVVLLDARTSGLDGAATLDALRAVDPGVLACLMTGEASPSGVGELLARGAASVIAKPFLLDELADHLRLLAHGIPANLLPPCGSGPGDGRPS